MPAAGGRHKVVLRFIDNDQRQPVKLHLFLKDSVGCADNHLHLTAGNNLLLRLTLYLLLTRQPTRFNAV